MLNRIPLTTLLSWTWIAHTIEVDNAVEAATSGRIGHHVRISLPLWTNGLRYVDEGGITVDELHARAHAACNIGGLERWGWLSVGEPGAERRDGYGSHRGLTGDTVLRPTRAGSYARRAWPRIVGEVEARWRTRFGDEVIAALRGALPAPATPMPWSPPEVAPADGFRSHVIDGPAGDGERPLAALLGRVLTGLTVEDERDAEVSLPLGANVLRVIGSDVLRLRDLPARSGISKQAIAMATNYLQRKGLATAVAERCISLTPAGLDALDDYRRRAAGTRAPALRGALETIVARADALSAGLVPPDGAWRGERPYLAQTQSLLADPTAALPWHPMVLHRAGWPDGS
ncbi:MAG: hypothetical protein ACR2F6_02950 [Mycobacteriales bacterium]